MRTAIWSAVSSKAQAETDKTSLQDQVKIGMDDIARKTTARQNLQTIAAVVEKYPTFIRTAPPQRVNANLHTFIQAIHLTKDHILTIEFK